MTQISQPIANKEYTTVGMMEEFPTLIPVVAAALIKPDGRILLQQRKIGSAHGGLWEFPGGKLEAAESPESGLIRELEEELGIIVEPGDLAPAHYAALPGEPIVILLYTCRRWKREPTCLDAEVIDWFALDDLAALPMPPLDVPLAKALHGFI